MDEITALKKGVSKQEIEKEKKEKAKLSSKVASLNESLATVTQQSESLLAELAELEKSPPRSKKAKDAALAKKREEAKTKTAMMGAMFETMHDQLQQRLKIAKADQEKISYQLAEVRDRWHQAKQVVDEAQAEVDGCQARIEEVSSVLLVCRVCFALHILSVVFFCISAFSWRSLSLHQHPRKREEAPRTTITRNARK